MKLQFFDEFLFEKDNRSYPYKTFFLNKLKQYNVKSPSKLSKEMKRKFFTEIRKEWKRKRN